MIKASGEKLEEKKEEKKAMDVTPPSYSSSCNLQRPMMLITKMN